MSAIENAAANIAPPIQGSIRVLSVTTSASSTQDLTEFLSDSSKRTGPRYITFICDVAWYITFNSSTTITDPDSTSTSGNGRTWLVPASQPYHVRVTPRHPYFKARGSASGTLRWYPSENAAV